MWKYIVTWLVIETYSVPCFPPPPTVDEYGRKTTEVSGIMINCLKTDTTRNEKYFDTRGEAMKFIKGGAGQIDLRQFKLDSIPLKQYNCQHIVVSKTMLACDPPNEECNSVTCLSCGKQWLTY